MQTSLVAVSQDDVLNVASTATASDVQLPSPTLGGGVAMEAVHPSTQPVGSCTAQVATALPQAAGGVREGGQGGGRQPPAVAGGAVNGMAFKRKRNPGGKGKNGR